MELERQRRVRLDHTERTRISRAMAHIRIAYPDYHERSSRENRNDGDSAICRALNRTVQPGEALDAALVDLALQGMDALAKACAEQADLPYWRNQLQEPREKKPGLEPRIAGSGGVPLIANPQDMCVMLAETREWQLSEVEEAQDVLREAASLLGPVTV